MSCFLKLLLWFCASFSLGFSVDSREELIHPDRWIVFNAVYLGRAGIADRLEVLKKALQFSIAMNATLVFPRPCEVLSYAHSREIANCSYGWDYYIKCSHYFVGLHGLGNTSITNLDKRIATNLTVELLNSLDRPPNGSFVLKTSFEFYDAIDPLVSAALRVLKNRQMLIPDIAFFGSDMVIRKADLLMQSLNIDGDAYGVMKIRRKDRGTFLHCTDPKAVMSKFYGLYQALNETERRLPWLVFGYVESGYWARLAKQIFLSPLSQSLYYPRLLFERDLHIEIDGTRSIITDNYIMIIIIFHIMYAARYSIGTYYYEGKHGHFCENELT